MPTGISPATDKVGARATADRPPANRRVAAVWTIAPTATPTLSNAEDSSSVRLMKLRLPEVVFLFVVGVLAALIGDHAHVVTGTTA